MRRDSAPAGSGELGAAQRRTHPGPINQAGIRKTDLGLLVFVAFGLRLVGLGHVSLWLDEILGTLQVAGRWSEAWSALVADRVHPPLWGALDGLWLRLSDAEPFRRCLPIGLGVIAVLLLALLVSRSFGRGAGLAAGFLLALSPIHVRFSQELRPYGLGIVAALLMMIAADGVDRIPPRRATILLALATALCAWSLYLSVVCLVPAYWLAWSRWRASESRRRTATRLALSALAAALLFLPWLGVLGGAVAKSHELPSTAWSWELAARRALFLTVAGVEGEGWAVGAIALILLSVWGAWSARRSALGQALLIGALGSSVGAEILLRAANHWSNGRYNLLSVPFLVALAGIGIVDRSAPLRRLRRVGGPALALLAGIGMLQGLLRYWSAGRVDWDSVAAEAMRAATPGTSLLVTNEWTRLSLGYYVARREGASASISPRVRVPSSLEEAALLSAGAPCAVLVDSWYPTPDWSRTAMGLTPSRLSFPRTGARLAAIPTDAETRERDPWRCSREGAESAPTERTGPFSSPPSRSEIRPPWTLAMDGSETPLLGAGWLGPERTPGGLSLRWASPRWASIRVPAATRELKMRARGLGDAVRLRLFVERDAVAEFTLSRRFAELEADLPPAKSADDWVVIDLRFEGSPLPAAGRPPRAAAFDWIELSP